MFTPSYKKNIALLGATEWLSFFGITSFWVLFLSQKGMSLLEIGLLESIFHGTSLLSEVPSGVLADRFSYKTNLYLSRLFNILSCLLMLAGNGQFWLYSLGMIVSAWSYNFDSGTSDAMLFESAKEAGWESRYLKLSSLKSGIAEATMTLGKVAAGFFVHGFLDVTYMVHIVFSLFVIGLVFFMKEPAVKEKSEQPPTIQSILQTVLYEFRTNPRLLHWLLTTQIICVVMCMFYFYYQNELPHLRSWQISLMMLLSSGLNISSVWLASWIGEKWSASRLFPSLVAMTGVLYLIALSGTPWMYILVYLLSEATYAFFLPIFNTDLQRVIPSAVRSTMLSVNAMFFSLSMIVLFPLTGWLIETVGFAKSFGVLGVCLLGLALLLQRERLKMKR